MDILINFHKILWRINEIFNSWRQEWHKAACWNPQSVANTKMAVFLSLKFHIFGNNNKIFCLKSQKGECFLPNEPCFSQVWWKLRIFFKKTLLNIFSFKQTPRSILFLINIKNKYFFGFEIFIFESPLNGRRTKTTPKQVALPIPCF